MNYWICGDCNYVFKGEVPPETCPSCKTKCDFHDITCYIPECGGPDNLDARLVAERMKELKKG